MRYGIVGVRDYNNKIYDNKSFIYDTLEKFRKDGLTEVVSGGGKGVESIVADWSKENNIKYKNIPPHIKQNGRNDAFLLRNIDIAKDSDVFVIFWDGLNSSMLRSLSYVIKDKKNAIIIAIQ